MKNNAPKRNISMKGSHENLFKEGEKAKNIKDTLIKLWNITKGNRKGLIPVMILPCFMSASAILAPYFIGKVINEISKGDKVTFAISALIIIYAADWLIRFTQIFLTASVSQKIIFVIRASFFSALKKLPLSFFDKRGTGDIMSRITNDIDNISVIISDSFGHILLLVFTFLGILFIMVSLEFRLALAVLAAVPLIIIFTKFVVRHTKVYFKEQQKALGRLNEHTEETISGLPAVKSFGAEKRSSDTYEKLNGELTETGTKALIWSGCLMPVMNVINNLSFIFVSVLGGVMASKGMTDVGTVASFLLYSRQFTRPVNEIAMVFNMFQSALAGAERVMEIMGEEREPEDKEGAASLKKECGNIVFDKVSFEFLPGELVLNNISFSVEKGEKIALVGPTGAGKTTIASLLMRFYDVKEGRILLDGIDIKNYRLKEIRGAFCTVLQDASLFNATITENIRYGKEDASEEDVINAAKAAMAHDFIMLTPQGYNTEIEAGGSNLSHGERQLITIARAILSDAPMMILDEATSSVDTRTEKHIQNVLKKITKNRTTFIIAHRLSTIRDADRIIFINKGRIAETGTHEELLNKGGMYADLYKMQTS